MGGENLRFPGVAPGAPSERFKLHVYDPAMEVFAAIRKGKVPVEAYPYSDKPYYQLYAESVQGNQNWLGRRGVSHFKWNHVLDSAIDALPATAWHAKQREADDILRLHGLGLVHLRTLSSFKADESFISAWDIFRILSTKHASGGFGLSEIKAREVATLWAMNRSEWKLVSPSSGERDYARKNADSFIRLFEMVGAVTYGFEQCTTPYEDFLRRTAFIANFATVKGPSHSPLDKQNNGPKFSAEEAYPKDVVAGALLAQYAHYLERKRPDLGHGYSLTTHLSMMVEGVLSFEESYRFLIKLKPTKHLEASGPNSTSESEITFSLAVTNLVSSLLLSAEQSVPANTDPDSTIILDGLPMAQCQLESAQERVGEIAGDRPLLSAITDYLSDVENGLQTTRFLSNAGNGDVVFGLGASTFARCRI